MSKVVLVRVPIEGAPDERKNDEFVNAKVSIDHGVLIVEASDQRTFYAPGQWFHAFEAEATASR